MNTYRLALPGTLGVAEAVELRKALQAASVDEFTRSITLVGSGHLFAGGLDLVPLVGGEKLPAPAQQRAILGEFGRLLLLLRSAQKPTLALVDGAVLGNGVGLVAACDVVLGTERASFAFPEMVLGSIPALVLPLLRERMSEHRIRLWLMSGLSRGPQAALAAGLVDQIVSSADLEREHLRWLRKLDRTPLRAVRELKQAALPALTRAMTEAENMAVSSLTHPDVRRAVLGFATFSTVPWEEE
jgi:enoyl-CoA hydratase/carnithine racemase